MSVSAQHHDVTLSRIYTLCDSQVQFLHDDVLAFRVGNVIVLFTVSKREYSMLTFEKGLQLDAFAVNPAKNLIVCTLHGSDSLSRLVVYKVGFSGSNREVLHTISTESFVCTHIALSRDGTRAVTLSTLFDAKIMFWDLQEGKLLAEAPFVCVINGDESSHSPVCSFVSFNPRNNQQFCTGSPDGTSIILSLVIFFHFYVCVFCYLFYCCFSFVFRGLAWYFSFQV